MHFCKAISMEIEININKKKRLKLSVLNIDGPKTKINGMYDVI